MGTADLCQFDDMFDEFLNEDKARQDDFMKARVVAKDDKEAIIVDRKSSVGDRKSSVGDNRKSSTRNCVGDRKSSIAGEAEDLEVCKPWLRLPARKKKQVKSKFLENPKILRHFPTFPPSPL